jgi:hypothetical protein
MKVTTLVDRIGYSVEAVSTVCAQNPFYNQRVSSLKAFSYYIIPDSKTSYPQIHTPY